MLRTFLRQSLVVLAAAALYLPIALCDGNSVQALTITLPSTCTLSVDGQGNGNVTCSGGGGPGFSCSLSASVPFPTITSVETLTASCSNATGSVTYSNWTAAAGFGCPGFSGTPSGNQATLQTPTAAVSSCVYSVTATDSGSANAVHPSVNLTYTSGSGGGGGVDTSACVAVGLNPVVVTIPWPTAANGNQLVLKPPTFGPNDALIVKFTTSSVTTVNAKGNITAAENGGSFYSRSGTLSASPCDFTGGLQKWQNSNTTWFQGQNPSFSFTLFNPLKNYAKLDPGTTYYLNITNISPAPPQAGGSQGCTVSNCPMIITLSIPAGT
jgi:hypothetical protein